MAVPAEAAIVFGLIGVALVSDSEQGLASSETLEAGDRLTIHGT